MTFGKFSSISIFGIIVASAFSIQICAAQSYASRAPDDTLQPYVSASVVWDDNLFRLPDGDTPSDRITRVGVGLKLDKTVSRQRFLANLNLEQNSYERTDILDHVSGNAGAKWLWAIGSQWEGGLGYDYRRFLSQFSDLSVNNVRLIVKNLVDRNTFSMTGGYQVHPRWRFWAGADFFESTNSAVQVKHNDVTIETGSLGIDYRTPSDNSVGLLLKYSEGSFPNREVVASRLINNQYTETSPALTWAWNLTGKSRFNGRFGYTVRKHEQFSARDFSDPTFLVQYLWLPTGKLRVTADVLRELSTTETDTSSFVVVNAVRLNSHWAITPKISLLALFSYETRSYEGNPGVVLGAPVREDTTRMYQVIALYAPWRYTEVLLLLQRGVRTSNLQQFQFDYNLAQVNLRINF